MDGPAIERAIAGSDWRELIPWLSGLAEDERAHLRPAYRSRWRATARRSSETLQLRPRIVQLGLAIGLSDTPDEASRNCGWGGRFAWTDGEVAFPHLVQLLLARGEEWASQFAALAAATRVRGESARGAAEITALTLPVYARTGRTIPEGALALGWTQIVGSAAIASSPPVSDWMPIRLAGTDLDDADVAYPIPTRLEEVLASTPRLSDVLVAALRTPDALAELAGMKGVGWDIDVAIRTLIGKDLLNRGLLMDETLAALARADRPTAQRVMSELLRGADFSGADAVSRLPIISHLMPAVHGSVTMVLLAAALDADLGDDALLDIGSVILARKEKAQKQLLLRTLMRGSASPAVDALLAIASTDIDAAFAAKARSARGHDSPAVIEAPADDVIWSLPIEGYQSVPVCLWSADAAGLDAARSDAVTWVRITSNAAALDLAVRFAQRDLSLLREAILAAPPPPELGWWSGQQVLPLLHQWCSTGARRRSYRMTRTNWVWGPDGAWRDEGEETVDITPPPHREFTERLVEETLGRLGEISELVSTPSSEDGSLTVGDLERRLDRARRQGVGHYDLVQALLRLEPVLASDAARFERLSTRLWSGQKRWFGGVRSLDAGHVVAEWIRAGGLPARHVSADANAVLIHRVQLPLPPQLSKLDGLDALCAPVELVKQGLVRRPSMSLSQADDVALYLGVAPYWTDAAAALLEVGGAGDSIFTAKSLSILVAAPGRFETGAHQLLARMQSHPRQDARLLAVEAMGTLAAEDRLDRTLLREATVALFEAGELSLTRLADAWDNAMRIGLLAWIWPALTGVLSDALTRNRMPAGLAELIRVVSVASPAAIAHAEFGEAEPLLRELAAGRSSSKAAQEARALIEVLDGVRA